MRQQPAEEELEVQSAIQQIALEHRRRYGYPHKSPCARRPFAEISGSISFKDCPNDQNCCPRKLTQISVYGFVGNSE